ncbi:MAG: bifunctional demethylmenaquinone methyltransferase/2-methoxy-6-polyprenyl-1,4-benzoquinol methylase UbiE, partial [Gammaproteobacteria bacterium]|nr:bifunctional demethylmenaquinone methyltransferase/2-methoxy-6-polyprenyl-1,4-benzoquinol methylase UbiE [Gammaproteobacteria bacterium]
YQVMRPGSRLLVLEFSKPVIPLLEKIYHEYSFRVIPTIGKIVARDRDSYQYLVESIRQHPDQETLADMMAQAGFERVEYFNLTGGIVAMHVAWKL